MTALSFYKMSGSGNDFVFLDGRETALACWTRDRTRELCDRRSGIGADGLVMLSPEATDAVRMIYFNADGSRAGMCGNAALCSTRLAARLGMAPGSGMLLHTDTGVLHTRCVGPAWSAELLLPEFAAPLEADLLRAEGEHWMVQCSVGVPHLIVLVDDVTAVDVVGRGRALRSDPAFTPAGTNVNFVGRAPGAGEGKGGKGVGTEGGPEPRWVLRTYERGVEAETLACGTGTVGAAFALAQRGLDQLPIRIRSWGGNVFSVAGRCEGEWAREPWLCGEGRLVFEGQLIE